MRPLYPLDKARIRVRILRMFRNMKIYANGQGPHYMGENMAQKLTTKTLDKVLQKYDSHAVRSH